jgi:hypothetical protein
MWRLSRNFGDALLNVQLVWISMPNEILMRPGVESWDIGWISKISCHISCSFIQGPTMWYKAWWRWGARLYPIEFQSASILLILLEDLYCNTEGARSTRAWAIKLLVGDFFPPGLKFLEQFLTSSMQCLRVICPDLQRTLVYISVHQMSVIITLIRWM